MYSAPKHKSTLGGSHMGNGMSKGIENGLSEHYKCDVDESAPGLSTDGHNGFQTQRIKPRTTKSASKYGKSFQIEK